MKKQLFLLGLILVSLLLHSASRYHTFSLFQAIESIPILIMLVNPTPAVLAFFIFVLLELFSSLPHGSMVLMFFIPYAVSFIWKKMRVELSWKFLGAVFLMITLQTLALVGIVSSMNIASIYSMPWNILLLQMALTTVGTFSLAFAYHEYSERI
jgi:hypothetical protein